MRRTSLSVGLLAGALLLVAPAAQAATWSDQAVADPSGATMTELSGVGCASASECVAVGKWDRGGSPMSLAAGWNGSAWSLQSPATPSSATSHELAAASCSGTRACTAVGTYDAGSGAQPHVQRWTGSWATQAAPAPVGATATRLTGVSCTSASACTAVGYYTDGSGTHTLALRWNSGTWSIQSTPNPVGASLSLLSSVSCDASENCVAVGTNYGSDQESLVMSRSGGTGSWTLETAPVPAGSAGASLSSVACRASGACIAVGAFTDGTTFDSAPMAMTRASGTWRLTTAPALAVGAQGGWYSGVACVATNDCTAVGASYDSSYRVSSLGGDYDGSTWTAAAPGLPSGWQSGQLVSIACAASKNCSAVGRYVDRNGATRALASRYQ
jgi:hypothetical protein